MIDRDSTQAQNDSTIAFSINFSHWIEEVGAFYRIILRYLDLVVDRLD